MRVPIPALVGQLLTVGFHGTHPTPTISRALQRGERGGIILFKRNLTEDVFEIPALNRELASLSTSEIPLLIAVDQEGGRVARVKGPALRVPPMLQLANLGDDALLRSVATAQAKELTALGFTMNFSPILDVNSRPENPIIGDRAFSEDAPLAASRALLYAAGLHEGGILSCGKHFPGHGDTTKDSHLELPRVSHPRDVLDRVELLPFRLAAKAALPAFMSAHVVYDALDPHTPATLSRTICTELLRGELGFGGVLFSDDLEMKALSGDVEDLAVGAIQAGCDALLICSDEDLADRAFAALVKEAERSDAFRARVEEAYGRFVAMKTRSPAPASKDTLSQLFQAHTSIAVRLAPLLERPPS